jgi:hypothetical protein
VWRSHFGQTAGIGAGSSANVAIPEPISFGLLLTGTLAACCAGARSRRKPLGL